MGQTAQVISFEQALGADAPLRPEALAAANINPGTYLATDYLNHYNEIIMMIDLLPDMPDCLEDVEAWSPRSYEEHFRASSFQGKDLAIAAYAHAAPEVRAHFEFVGKRLDARIISFTADVRTLLERGDMDGVARLCKAAGVVFTPLLDELNAIIHGATDSAAHVEAMSDHDHTQAEIDALFD